MCTNCGSSSRTSHNLHWQFALGLRPFTDLTFCAHLQELAAVRAQLNTGSVNVEVEAAPQQDLASVMEEMRAQYEGITEKNRREMEAWYKGKVRGMKCSNHVC